MFSVIEQVVEANPIVLRKYTREGVSPLRALFHSYIQSIPGHLAVAQILEGKDVEEGHFERFWQKAEYLALEDFKIACGYRPEENLKDYVVHAFMRYGAPLNLLKVAYMRNPAWLRVADKDGNLPLHVLVERRPYRLWELETIEAMVNAYPEATTTRNHMGDEPLFLAIRNKIPWNKGLGAIVSGSPSTVSNRDRETGLYPFQLVAALGGKASVNTTFELLCAQPVLVHN